MRVKILSLALISLSLDFCAAAAPAKKWVTTGYFTYLDPGPERPTRQTLTFADRSYDQVWEACEKALIRLSFEFYPTEKDSGEIKARHIIHDPKAYEATNSRELPPQAVCEISASISEANGGVSLTVSSTYYELTSAPFPWSLNYVKQQYEIDRVIRAIKKRL